MKTKNYYPITTALGSLTALAVTAHAATVQITLTGNKSSSPSSGGNTLNADITGDTIDDFVFSNFVNIAAQAFFQINGQAVNSNRFGSIGNYNVQQNFQTENETNKIENTI